jgi:hypothetical protein
MEIDEGKLFSQLLQCLAWNESRSKTLLAIVIRKEIEWEETFKDVNQNPIRSRRLRELEKGRSYE